MKTRPCFLVIDREHPGSISTRKLVLETAKFNVITAYSASEAIETLETFPNVSGVVTDGVLSDMRCDELIVELKKLQPQLPVVVVSSRPHGECEGADHYVESFNPARLLLLLQNLNQTDAAAIEAREEQLENKP